MCSLLATSLTCVRMAITSAQTFGFMQGTFYYVTAETNVPVFLGLLDSLEVNSKKHKLYFITAYRCVERCLGLMSGLGSLLLTKEEEALTSKEMRNEEKGEKEKTGRKGNVR